MGGLRQNRRVDILWCGLQFIVGEEMRLVARLLFSLPLLFLADATLAQERWELRCTFTHGHGNLDVQDFGLRFSGDDTYAYIVSDAGSQPVSASYDANRTVTFTQTWPDGSRRLTSIGQNLTAIHYVETQYSYSSGWTSYYGTCETLQ